MILETLTKIMPNVGGAGSAYTIIRCEVVESIVLYGAPIWADAMRGSIEIGLLHYREGAHLWSYQPTGRCL